MPLPKIKKGYKIVKVQSNKSKMSFITPFYFGETVYRKGRWTKPNPGCGPLCVFSKREDVRNCLIRNKQYVIAERLNTRSKCKFEVWECEYVYSEEVTVYVFNGLDLSYPTLKSDLILGTELADKVRLLQKVVDDNVCHYL